MTTRSKTLAIQAIAVTTPSETPGTSGHLLLAQYRACWRKKIYHDEDAAQRGARQARNKYGAKQRPYKCPYGLHYHLATVRDG